MIITEDIEKPARINQNELDFVAHVSHDLKIPLNAIYSAIQLIFSSYSGHINGDQMRLFEILFGNIQRMKLLINNMIDISRLGYYGIKLNLVDENLSIIIKKCVNNMRHMIKLKNINYYLNIPEKVYLRFDIIKMGQVFTNIISNAIKNTPMGGIIVISLEETEDFIDVKFKDSGIGLTENEKNSLFKKYCKIDTQLQGLDKEFDGTGIGLFLSKEIIELHNGQIFVKSKGRDNGSTFIIRLYKNMDNL